MNASRTADHLAHWQHEVPGFVVPPPDFYLRIEQILDQLQIPDVHVRRIIFRERGWFSARRIYLRIERYRYIYDLCAAPFGSSCFFSSWLHYRQNWLVNMLGLAAENVPILGFFLRPFIRKPTYHEIDSAFVFQKLVHSAVLEAVNALAEAKGLKQLTEEQAKPVFHGFLAEGKKT